MQVAFSTISPEKSSKSKPLFELLEPSMNCPKNSINFFWLCRWVVIDLLAANCCEIQTCWYQLISIDMRSKPAFKESSTLMIKCWVLNCRQLEDWIDILDGDWIVTTAIGVSSFVSWGFRLSCYWWMNRVIKYEADGSINQIHSQFEEFIFL